MHSLADKDRSYLWHPFTQMKDWVRDEPVVIESGEGAILRDIHGNEYIDANASIWTNLHGHRHPKITAAIKTQLDKIAHSSFLGLSNVPAIQLAEKLIGIAQATLGRRTDGSQLTRVFYSDDGSTAMEVAIKMALQYWAQKKQGHRTRFVAFGEAYHGDTIGAVSLGGIDLFHALYRPLLFEVLRCRDRDELARLLNDHGRSVAAIAIEPLIQGAAGMRLWPKGMLRHVADLCRRHDVLLIVDEVMTGFGRTGSFFACEREKVVPDLMALAKGLTGGYLPLAATLTTEEIFGAFLGEYPEQKTFFHGHSYTGNQLGCAAALANLEIFDEEDTLEKLPSNIQHLSFILESLRSVPHVGDIRQCGFIAGVELFRESSSKVSYDYAERAGARVCQEMRNRGVLTRPIGNTIVVMPPYCITRWQLNRIVDVMRESILAALGA
jgi:adenosylmethionine-8-amino-7-oxononanoate transaminase